MLGGKRICTTQKEVALSRVTTIDELEVIYGNGAIAEASTAKVADRIIPEYRQLIEGSPFVALATSGPEGDRDP